MTGPVDGPIDARVEWFYDGGWQDVTDDVDPRSEITVSYGQPDEHGQAEPTEINLLMRNELGQSSPEDPNGERFGKIGRGTRMRVRIGDPQPTADLFLPGVEGSYASTPDAAVLDITGDIDVRVDIDPGGRWFEPSAFVIMLASKYATTSNQRSWALYVVNNGILRLTWSPDGTGASRITISSTAGIPLDSRRVAVRATLDVNNGSGGNTVTFYTAATIAGPWTQLGPAVITAGTTSVFSSTAPVELGSAAAGVNPFGGAPLSGTVYGFELRNGIGGTAVANPDFTALVEGTTSFTDAAGRTWALLGGAEIVVRDPSIRGSVAAVSWVPTWDETGLDARMAVRGAGILERLGHGHEPLRSPLTYDLATAATTVAYWPLEDGKDATSVAAVVGGQPLTVTGGVTMASYDGFAGSAPVPTFDTGGHILGRVPAYTPNVRQRVACMLHQTDSPPGDTNLIATTCTGGTISQAILVLKADGSLRIVLRDFLGTNVLDFSGGVGDLRGENAMVWMLLTQNGANIDWQIGKIAEGESAVTIHFGTLASYSYGRFTTINIGTDADMAGTGIGHLHIVNGDDSGGLWTTAANSLIAWSGERAAHRVHRLCHQESVPCIIDGSTAATEQIGPQGVDQLLTIIDASAAVDAGRWGERRDAYSLLYRARADLYQQQPALTLDMADGTITSAFSPPLDTQSVRNDVTVSRDGGSSYRAIEQTGPLSVQDPPNGIGGSYPSSPQLNLYSDTQLVDQATWRLALGTAPGHRIAQLEIEMEHHPDLVQAVLELRNGDIVRVENTPTGLPPGPIDLMVLGATDSITAQTWRVTLNCAPGSPWEIGVLDDPDHGRLDTDGSTLAADFDAGTDTQMAVASGWFEDFEDSEYVVDIATSWSRSNTSAHAGTWSLRSPDIGDGERTDAIVTIPAGAVSVGFWYRVSSEAAFDKLEVYVDSTLVLSASGDTGWVQVAPGTFDITGAATLKFRYQKDSSDSSLLDCVFVDELNFIGGYPRWTTDPGEFPFEVQATGVVLEVTAITGTTSPQTFTVTATPVNGVEKTIPAGADVRLVHPMILGL